MDLASNEILADLSGWQRMLDRHGELFTELASGSRIGLLARLFMPAFASAANARAEALRHAPGRIATAAE